MGRLIPSGPTIVTLCGSTRFREEFEAANRRETLAGKIVLSTGGIYGHREGMDMDGEVKRMLDALHMRKVAISDEVLVLDVGGYVGSSTRREIEHALALGVRVRYLSEELTVGAATERLRHYHENQ